MTALAVWLAQDTVGLDPYRPLPSASPPLRIEVIGYDWKWLFVYPDYGSPAWANSRFPPAGLSPSSSPRTRCCNPFSFRRSEARSTRCPAWSLACTLKRRRPARCRGENTQYNGDAFEKQKFTAMAMTPADFDAWIRLVEAKGIPMTPETYQVCPGRGTPR